MAYPTEVTLETGGAVRERGGDQELRVRVTCALEPLDDLETIVADLATRLERAHALAWRRVRGGEPEPVPERPRLEIVGTGRKGEGAQAMVTDSPQGTCEDTDADDPPATAPQVIALRSHAYRAGRSRAELDEVVSERFARDSVERLTKTEAAAFLLSLQRDGWKPAAAPIA